MKKHILIIALFFSLSLFAKSQTEAPISCFADVHFGKSTISVDYDHHSINPRMSPQVFYRLVLIDINITREYCTKSNDIEVEVERINTSIQSSKISALNELEQDELLHQIALSLIWNKLFLPEVDIIQSQIDEMELYGSIKNKENLHLITNLYHQVFGGE
ncbi:MAG: hypothetical protein B7C24_00825 [Bacteroidetes bacterium 4572_77]|nr:MAG: hypothetical protein B7C24_00825 [Bacteroidetes bacterium 4572_77]